LKKLLLFDIDGTLLHEDNATRRTINRTFSELFKIKNPEHKVPFAGRTDLGIFREIALALLGRPLEDGELKTVADRYITLLPAELEKCESFRLMPGITELLPVLSNRGDIVLGLETGNLEATAYIKLKHGKIDRYFSLGGFGSDSADRAELIRLGIKRARALNHNVIANENVFVIGDTPNDIKSGKAAGAMTIAVGTGYADQEKILAENPDFYLKDLSNIPAFLRCIGCEA
jgi:phosphoglycolate phosphatase